MGPMSLLLLISLSFSGGNDLLDYIPAKDYWSLKSVEITVENMLAELGKGKDASGGNETAASVRKLMAIRALGMLKAQEAKPALERLRRNAMEPFVGDYAAWALAAIDGTTYSRPEASLSERQKDLGLLPGNCGVAAQLSPGGVFAGSGPVDFDKAFKQAAPMLQMMTRDSSVDTEAMRKQYVQMAVGFTEMIGNIRFQGMTFGLSQDVENNQGFVVFVVRGLYNKKNVSTQLATFARNTEIIQDVTIYFPDREFALIPANDNTFLMVGGPERDELPLAAIVNALKSGRKGLQDNPGLEKLADSIDETACAWALATMGGTYKQVDLFKPLDSITVSAKQTEKQILKLTARAKGKEKEQVSQALTQFNGYVSTAIQELKDEIDQAPPFLSPILEFLESIQTRQTDATAIIEASWKGNVLGTLLVPLMGFRAQASLSPVR